MTDQDSGNFEELVILSRNGDRDAFAKLYDRYARLVRAIFFDEVSSEATSLDLAQETFLRAWMNLNSLRNPERFGAWLTGIARQIRRENRRSLQRDRHRFVGGNPANAASAEMLPLNESSTSEETTLVLKEVAQLPELERLAVHAFYLEEQNADQVAKVLGMSRSGVYRLLRRACGRLATRFRSMQLEQKSD